MASPVAEKLLRNVPELGSVLEIGSILGEGTFSTVYNGSLLPKFASNEEVPKRLAIKAITPIVEPQMLENELRCLTLLKGKSNVIKLLFALRHHDRLVLVMPYFEHDRFCRLVRRFKSSHVRDYMYQLLVAVHHMHNHNIIHRDIKPNNFLYSTKTNQHALVDFGLAQIVQPDKTEDAGIKNYEEQRCPLEDLTLTKNNSRTSLTSLCDKPKKAEKRRGDQVDTKACNCPGHASVCRMCIGTPAVVAPRAGTAGYRPPEVFM